MNVSRGRTDMLGDDGQKRDDIVLNDLFNPGNFFG
jgi:hypothetical protein